MFTKSVNTQHSRNKCQERHLLLTRHNNVMLYSCIMSHCLLSYLWNLLFHCKVTMRYIHSIENNRVLEHRAWLLWIEYFSNQFEMRKSLSMYELQINTKSRNTINIWCCYHRYGMEIKIIDFRVFLMAFPNQFVQIPIIIFVFEYKFESIGGWVLSFIRLYHKQIHFHFVCTFLSSNECTSRHIEFQLLYWYCCVVVAVCLFVILNSEYVQNAKMCTTF